MSPLDVQWNHVCHQLPAIGKPALLRGRLPSIDSFPVAELRIFSYSLVKKLSVCYVV
jgi:hypothetical protein